MIPDALRPVLNLAVGVSLGFLVAWGFFARFSNKSGSAPVSPELTSTPSLASALPTATPKPVDENIVTETNSVASVSPSPASSGQRNGLPQGVTQDALNYNKELYRKYPGLRPPLINTDGRDLGPEAREQMQAPPTMLPNPTPSPGVSVSPFPLVLPNKPAIQSTSPLPSQ
jgi:hypothetical protein